MDLFTPGRDCRSVSQSVSVPAEAKLIAATFTPVGVMTATKRAITKRTKVLRKFCTPGIGKSVRQGFMAFKIHGD